MRTFMRKRWYLFTPLIFVFIAAFGYITMWLWNTLMPVIFHLPIITFWQAIGILILSRILFGGGGRTFGKGHHHWRGHIRDKWGKMSPEEREKFFHHWQHERSPFCERPGYIHKETESESKNE